MRESTAVKEWMAEGEARGRQQALLVVLQENCDAPVPDDLAAEIQAVTDASKLGRWLRAAVKASSYDNFRAAIKS